MEKGTPRILRSRAARDALEKAQRVAEQAALLLRQAKDLEEARPRIYELFDRELGDDEYLLLIDADGRALIHTNRLREGGVFNDPVGRNAAQTAEPLLQLYPRNTGEVVIDASCPVMAEGAQRYNLRLGRIVHRPFLKPAVFGVGLIPPAVAGGAALAFGWKAGVVAALSGLLVGAVGAGLLHATLEKRLRMWLRMARNVSSGDLTKLVEERRQDRFHQIGYELNKIVLGMRAILSELAQAAAVLREISARQAGEARDLAEGLASLNEAVQNIRQGTEQQFAALEEALAMIQEVARRRKR
ncbi:methyl-accepting chemotaxis protein [Calditerricola satsumensis]|uniref:methyl-accepting chemotaxis protein n=1 Tax=Calditerricola satsumensis TaxID=373054 RepID=UPI0006CF7811|nr:methyl-accepting chemotaxis protein [Calditerricola satsumensis]